MALTVVLTLTLLGATVSNTVFNPPEGDAPVALKRPWDLRLDVSAQVFLEKIEPYLENRVVLPAAPLVPTLALKYPELKLHAARPGQTVRRFTMIGDRDEGVRRKDAQFAVTRCGALQSPARRRAVLASLENGVELVLAKDCGEKQNKRLLQLLRRNGRWAVVGAESGWIAFGLPRVSDSVG